MKEVSEYEYQKFKEQHGVNDNTCMSVLEQFPDGSYSKIYYMGINRKVKMCSIIHSVSFYDKTFYYIF